MKQKVVEKFVKTLFYGEKHSFIEWTYVVGAHWNASMRQFQCVPTTYVTEIKEPYFDKYHVHWLSSYKHPKLPISIKLPVTLLQIVYICMTAISPNHESSS